MGRYLSLTLQQVRGIRRNLDTHHSRRLGVQSDPGFVEHAEPLGVLGDRLGIGRGKEEFDSVVRVGLKGGESSFNDSDCVLLDKGRGKGSDHVQCSATV